MPDATARSSTALTDQATALHRYTEIRDHESVRQLQHVAASLEAMSCSLHALAAAAPSHAVRRAALDLASTLNGVQRKFRIKHGLTFHHAGHGHHHHPKQK